MVDDSTPSSEEEADERVQSARAQADDFESHVRDALAALDRKIDGLAETVAGIRNGNGNGTSPPDS